MVGRPCPEMYGLLFPEDQENTSGTAHRTAMDRVISSPYPSVLPTIDPTRHPFRFLSSQTGRICLNNRNELADPLREKWLVKGSKMLAGHFLWGKK